MSSTERKVVEVEIPYNFKPREYQKPFFQAMEDGYRFAILLFPRRHGKDKTAFNYIIRKMAEEVGNYAYMFPTASLARKAAWQNIDSKGFRLLDHIPKELIVRKLNNQMFIELKNGSTLVFLGSDKQVNVGTNFRGIVFSEFALQDVQTYYYLRPVILENNGFIVIATTPRGKNDFYDIWKLAEKNPKWFTHKLTWKEAGVFTEAEIEEERKNGMSDEMINSEYNTEFGGLEGSYYIRYLDRARLSHQIGHVPYDPGMRVNTVWDLGISDSTAIIFYQQMGNEIHVIDSYENEGEGLAHYVNIVDKKARLNGWVLGKHYAPHDISNRELGSGLSRKDTASGMGLNFIVLPTLRMSIAEGIECVRGTFPRVWFNEPTCPQLIKALENYVKSYDDKRKVYNDKPLHNWASHFSDSFRYLCIAIKVFGNDRGGFTTEELYAMNKQSRRI